MRALVIEDNAKRAHFLLRLLKEAGFNCETCTHGDEATERAKKGSYAVILLGWTPPNGNIPSFCKWLRRHQLITPILVVATHGGAEECVQALHAGADAYLVEPFKLDELTQRVHTLIKRSFGIAKLQIGPLAIEPESHTVLLRGQKLHLTSREYAFLLHMAYYAEKPILRTELLVQVWPNREIKKGSPLVEVLVSRLRTKFGEYRWMISTVAGHGYRLRAEPDGNLSE